MRDEILATELERVTGFTDDWMRKIANKGYFPKPEGAVYSHAKTIQGLLKYYREQNKLSDDRLAEVEYRTAVANQKLAEQKLARGQREVIPARSVFATWETIITTVRQRLIGLPAKMVGGLAICFTPAEQQAFLQREIDDVLTTLSQPATYAYSDEPDDSEEGDAPQRKDVEDGA